MSLTLKVDMKIVITSTLAIAAMLSGCATAYKPDGISGGFSETQLDVNVWRVTFEGNGYTRGQRSNDLALLRSAELTLINGYTHFGLADSKSDARTGTFVSPTTYNTTGNAYVSGNSIYGASTTRSSGGQVFNFSAPSSTNTVVMFKGKPDTQSMVYDAAFVCNSLGKQYQVVCGSKP